MTHGLAEYHALRDAAAFAVRGLVVFLEQHGDVVIVAGAGAGDVIGIDGPAQLLDCYVGVVLAGTDLAQHPGCCVSGVLADIDPAAHLVLDGNVAPVLTAVARAEVASLPDAVALVEETVPDVPAAAAAEARWAAVSLWSVAVVQWDGG